MDDVQLIILSIASCEIIRDMADVALKYFDILKQLKWPGNLVPDLKIQ